MCGAYQQLEGIYHHAEDGYMPLLSEDRLIRATDVSYTLETHKGQ